jgi:neurofibromin 1
MLTFVCHSCVPLLGILDDVLISCQNTTTLESAHQLFRTLTAIPKFSNSADSTEMLDEVLEGIGFGGLWRSSTFHGTNDLLRQCTSLTDRLIEVCDSICIPSVSHEAMLIYL